MLHLAFTTDWQRPGASKALPSSVQVELNVLDREEDYVLGVRGALTTRARELVWSWQTRTVDLPSMWYHSYLTGFTTVSQYSYNSNYMSATITKPASAPFPRDWLEANLKVEPLSAMLYSGLIEDRFTAFMDRAEQAYRIRDISPNSTWRESKLLASAWAGMIAHKSGPVTL